MISAILIATSVTLPKSGLVTPGQMQAVERAAEYKREEHRLHLAHVRHEEHEAALEARREAERTRPVIRAVTVSPAPVSTPSPASTPDSGGSAPSGGIQGCIARAESGGDSQVMNSSGHYGTYQFDESTWESGGGSASDFGHASEAEQDSVFQNVYAARGSEPWTGDGCA